MAKFTAF